MVSSTENGSPYEITSIIGIYTYNNSIYIFFKQSKTATKWNKRKAEEWYSSRKKATTQKWQAIMMQNIIMTLSLPQRLAVCISINTQRYIAAYYYILNCKTKTHAHEIERAHARGQVNKISRVWISCESIWSFIVVYMPFVLGTSEMHFYRSIGLFTLLPFLLLVSVCECVLSGPRISSSHIGNCNHFWRDSYYMITIKSKSNQKKAQLQLTGTSKKKVFQ